MSPSYTLQTRGGTTESLHDKKESPWSIQDGLDIHIAPGV
jgi:hypothetical protein